MKRNYQKVLLLITIILCMSGITGCGGKQAAVDKKGEEKEVETNTNETQEVMLYFIRSGHTILDEQNRIQGCSDSPLSQEGMQTLKNTAIGLSDVEFQVMYTSDRLRDRTSVETIIEENCSNQIPSVNISGDLRPMNLDKYEGELKSDSTNELVDKMYEENEEVYNELKEGYINTLHEIVEKVNAQGGQNALIAVDDFVINSILESIDESQITDHPHNSITKIKCQNKEYQVLETAEESYTKKGAEFHEQSDGSLEIYLVRHGKTIFNTNDRVQGWADSPLTEEGREVAIHLGKGLSDINFVMAYSSDLDRTTETARLILNENETSSFLNVHRISGLRETNYGKYEAGWNEDMNQASYEMYNVSSWEEISSMDKSVQKVLTAVHASDETGQAENYDEMSTRVSTAFEELIKKESQKGGGNILVVSHGHAIMAIMDKVCQTEVSHVENSAVCKIIYKDGEYTVESVNDKSYIEKGEKKDN